MESLAQPTRTVASGPPPARNIDYSRCSTSCQWSGRITCNIPGRELSLCTAVWTGSAMSVRLPIGQERRPSLLRQLDFVAVGRMCEGHRHRTTAEGCTLGPVELEAHV